MLCSQDQLANTSHTFKLVVDSASEAYPFMLDTLEFRISSQQYENLAEHLGANVTASATSSSSTSSASATPTVAASESHGVSAAPIVGGVLGAVVGLGLMALGIYLVVRRRRQAYSKLVDAGVYIFPGPMRGESRAQLFAPKRPTDMQQPGAEIIVPFMASARQPSAPMAISSTAAEGPEAAFVVQGTSTVEATYNPSPAPSTDTAPPRQVRKSVTAGLLGALGRARQRTDPGSTMSDIPSEAPPMYSSRPSTR